MRRSPCRPTDVDELPLDGGRVDFARCEVAFTERIGPFVVQGAGHFLQEEVPEEIVAAIRRVADAR